MFNRCYSALLVLWNSFCNLFMVWDIYHVLQLGINICIENICYFSLNLRWYFFQTEIFCVRFLLR